MSVLKKRIAVLKTVTTQLAVTHAHAILVIGSTPISMTVMVHISC